MGVSTSVSRGVYLALAIGLLSLLWLVGAWRGRDLPSGLQHGVDQTVSRGVVYKATVAGLIVRDDCGKGELAVKVTAWQYLGVVAQKTLVESVASVCGVPSFTVIDHQSGRTLARLTAAGQFTLEGVAPQER